MPSWFGGLDGPHASPKGLRHGFGVAAVSAGSPLNLVQKWLGHAQLTTTAIYADAVGEEEQSIAGLNAMKRVLPGPAKALVPSSAAKQCRR